MTVAVLAGLFLFTALFLVAGTLEQRKRGARIQLERLRGKGLEISFGEMLGLRRPLAALREQIAATGVDRDPEDVLLWFALGTVSVAALAIYYGFVLLAVLMPALAWGLGRYLLAAGVSRRVRLLEVQFKDFLVTLSLHLAVVPAFQPSFMRAASQAEQPLKQYLDRAVTGMESGETTEEALGVLRQISSAPITAWVDSVVFAVRIKANLSAMCKRAAERLILRIKMAKRVEAHAAQSKSLMVSMAGVTLMMGVSTMISSPEFVEFYSSPAGVLAATGGLLAFAGTTLYILRRIDAEASR